MAACVFYATLLDESPLGLPGKIEKNGKVLVDLSNEQARRLQEIAWDTVEERKRIGGPTYTNPIGDSPIHMGDPFVIQHEGRYCLFGTNASNEGFTMPSGSK